LFMLGRILALLALGAMAAPAQEDGVAFFEKNVRPLFAKQCLSCHSATSQPVMGGLRLDDRALALKGGTRGPAIVPGKPSESLLLRVVRHEAGPLKMPPGPKMKDADQALLSQWIQMGAPWGATLTSQAPAQKFWAFVPPAKPAVPSNGAPTAIDAFLRRD